MGLAFSVDSRAGTDRETDKKPDPTDWQLAAVLRLS
jgi:hypothetical protein